MIEIEYMIKLWVQLISKTNYFGRARVLDCILSATRDQFVPRIPTHNKILTVFLQLARNQILPDHGSTQNIEKSETRGKTDADPCIRP